VELPEVNDLVGFFETLGNPMVTDFCHNSASASGTATHFRRAGKGFFPLEQNWNMGGVDAICG
jgi:hypothetical protein